MDYEQKILNSLHRVNSERLHISNRFWTYLRDLCSCFTDSKSFIPGIFLIFLACHLDVLNSFINFLRPHDLDARVRSKIFSGVSSLRKFFFYLIENFNTCFVIIMLTFLIVIRLPLFIGNSASNWLYRFLQFDHIVQCCPICENFFLILDDTGLNTFDFTCFCSWKRVTYLCLKLFFGAIIKQ